MRRRFQIHLSTAVILTFVAALILQANLSTHGVIIDAQEQVADYAHYHAYALVRGWPFKMWTDSVQYLSNFTDVPFVDIGGCFANAIVALLILALTTVCCEWVLSRKRSAKNHN